jgi:hypothetical protein
MKHTLEIVTQAALALSPEEQEIVAERLMSSIVDSADPKIKRAQLVEVRRRRLEVLSGKVRTISGSQALREIQGCRS